MIWFHVQEIVVKLLEIKRIQSNQWESLKPLGNEQKKNRINENQIEARDNQMTQAFWNDWGFQGASSEHCISCVILKIFAPSKRKCKSDQHFCANHDLLCINGFVKTFELAA